MNAGKVLKIAAPKYVENHPEHLRNDIIDNLNVLLTTAETFNPDLAATEANQELSPQGRMAAASRVAAATLATLTAVEATTIKSLSDRAKLVEESMLAKVTYSAPKDAAERIAHEMTLQEIRSQLRELPAAERLAVYLTSTDPLTLAAIETAPQTLSKVRPDGTRKLEPFIDPEQRMAAMVARAETANPTAANTLRELRSVREVYVHAVNGLRSEILAEVPDAAVVPVPTMA